MLRRDGRSYAPSGCGSCRIGAPKGPLLAPNFLTLGILRIITCGASARQSLKDCYAVDASTPVCNTRVAGRGGAGRSGEPTDAPKRLEERMPRDACVHVGQPWPNLTRQFPAWPDALAQCCSMPAPRQYCVHLSPRDAAHGLGQPGRLDVVSRLTFPLPIHACVSAVCVP